MTDAPLAGRAWLDAPATRALFAALDGDGAETRFVGGVVRDALLGRPVADVDLATTLPPDDVARRLKAARIRAVPTGLAHGTVTAVLEGHGYEITTLRRDVATDGRHAEVAFTSDWAADAARRDFTMNAMSADRSGRVYDYFTGRADLAAGRVRFVGDAEKRVAEDYLRILRFFRFLAWYGTGEIDREGLEACRAGAAGLARVSAERVRHEMLRLLAAPDPGTSLDAMTATGVLEALLGHPPADVRPLIALERTAGRAPDPLLRLAALAPGDAAALARRLRLARRERIALEAMAPPWTDLDADREGGPGDATGMRRALYRLGRETFERRALLAAANASEANGAVLAARLAAAADWRPRKLPIGGRDLGGLGLTPGPEIGAMMRELEAYWIERNFAPRPGRPPGGGGPPHAVRKGRSMSDDRAAALAANQAFYDAFAAGDMARMAAAWAEKAPVACAHPGAPLLVGRDVVLESWQSILTAPERPDILCFNAQVHLLGDSAYVTCYERLGGPRGATLLATNILTKEGTAWRIVHHHAAPTPVSGPPSASGHVVH